MHKSSRRSHRKDRKDPNFEYDLDDLIRLMKEQAISATEGDKPKRKSKKRNAPPEQIPKTTISAEWELKRTKQENLRL